MRAEIRENLSDTKTIKEQNLDENLKRSDLQDNTQTIKNDKFLSQSEISQETNFQPNQIKQEKDSPSVQPAVKTELKMGLKEIFRRFAPYFIDYKLQFLLAFIGMALAGGATAALARLVQPVLDEIFVNKNEELFYILPFAIVVVYFLKGAGTFMQAYFTAHIGQDTLRRFRDKLLQNLLGLDMKFYNEFRTGELISRCINDIERIRTIVSNLIPELLREIITAIGLLCVVIYQSPKLSFFALVVMPIAFYPISRMAKKMKKFSRSSQEKISDISSALGEIFTNIEIIKASNAQNYEHEKFVNENRKFFNINMRSVRIEQLVSPMMETIGAIGIAVVIIIGGRQVIDGALSVGEFFSFLTALFMLYTPIKRMVSLYSRMQDAVAAAERTFELMDRTSEIPSGEIRLNEPVKSIKFNNVKLKYDDKSVLNGVDLLASGSQLIALVGASGGGKTSLMNLLMRFYEFNDGEILINDTSIREFDTHSLRANIGLVSQRVYIFNDTIAKNVAYGREFDENKVIRALKMANAYEFVSQLPDGIEQVLSEFGANLSGGQRQRIAIARALYDDPQILIFDEATSALDNKSEKEITDAINALRQSKIIFVIAHRLSTVQNADKIAVLDGGKIVGFGSDSELENSCKTYAKLKGKALV